MIYLHYKLQSVLFVLHICKALADTACSIHVAKERMTSVYYAVPAVQQCEISITSDNAVLHSVNSY
jgi:hypothetical protein